MGRIIATTAGVSQAKEAESFSIQGGREGSEIVYIDGMKVTGDKNISSEETNGKTLAHKNSVWCGWHLLILAMKVAMPAVK